MLNSIVILVLTASLSGNCYYCPNYVNGKTEAQRCYESFQKSYSCKEGKWVFPSSGVADWLRCEPTLPALPQPFTLQPDRHLKVQNTSSTHHWFYHWILHLESLTLHPRPHLSCGWLAPSPYCVVNHVISNCKGSREQEKQAENSSLAVVPRLNPCREITWSLVSADSQL